MITVERARDVTEPLVSAVHRLLPQLSASALLPTPAQLQELVSSPCTTLFVARGDGPGDPDILGMLTLVVFFIPTGTRAWVEDVVVDAAARGQGVGGSLVSAALDAARARGAHTVDLTSRPSREAANRLYLRMGFQVRQTNVYRAVLSR